jgi:hypothetical protein
MKWIPIREVRRDEALLVHSEDHWNKVISLQCECANYDISLFLAN